MTEAQLTDQALERKTQCLRTAIEEWLRAKELTFDCGFQTWLEHFNDEPEEEPCVLLLWHGNELTDSIELQDELAVEVVQPLGFLSEPITHTLIGFYVDEDERLRQAYRSYFEWKWLLRLIESSYYGLYEEIFEYAT